jgi:hypothetical protein
MSFKKECYVMIEMTRRSLSFLAIIASLTFAAHTERFIGLVVFYSYDENVPGADEEK